MSSIDLDLRRDRASSPRRGERSLSRDLLRRLFSGDLSRRLSSCLRGERLLRLSGERRRGERDLLLLDRSSFREVSSLSILNTVD